jgi:uncharacterized repeat protein (TIGR03806 family)
MRRALVAALALLAACERLAPAPAPEFHAEDIPETLSEWKLMRAENGVLSLNKGAVPYDLATPLFSDYALKLRTVTLPTGAAATYNPDREFDFPVGTIISKTFYYPQKGADWTGDVIVGPEPAVEGGTMPLAGVRLIETRLLVHRAEGWVAIPYVWNEAQTDAVLRRTGEVKKLTLRRPDGREEPFAYIVPNQNQCAGCHATNNTTRALAPIGIKARHLNKASTFAANFNQLDHWIATGMLKGAPADGAAAPRNASWSNERSTRARAPISTQTARTAIPMSAPPTRQALICAPQRRWVRLTGDAKPRSRREPARVDGPMTSYPARPTSRSSSTA